VYTVLHPQRHLLRQHRTQHLPAAPNRQTVYTRPLSFPTFLWGYIFFPCFRKETK